MCRLNSTLGLVFVAGLNAMLFSLIVRRTPKEMCVYSVVWSVAEFCSVLRDYDSLSRLLRFSLHLVPLSVPGASPLEAILIRESIPGPRRCSCHYCQQCSQLRSTDCADTALPGIIAHPPGDPSRTAAGGDRVVRVALHPLGVQLHAGGVDRHGEPPRRHGADTAVQGGDWLVH